MLYLCLSFATLTACRGTLLVLGLSTGYFLFDALVFPRTAFAFEECLDDVSMPLPFPIGHAGDSGELLIVVGQAAGRPIVHTQQKICAVAGGAEVSGILLVVTDMPRHSRQAHSITAGSIRTWMPSPVVTHRMTIISE